MKVVGRKVKCLQSSGYGSEGAEVAESALVDDNLNGNPRSSSTILPNPPATLDLSGTDHNVR
ncbi:hypothetical protein PV326_012793, partial [Microctonus aethiopoides]